MERFRDIGRGELHDHFLATRGRIGGVPKAQVRVESEGGSGFEDGRDDEGCEWSRFEEEGYEGVFYYWGLDQRRFRKLCSAIISFF